MSSIFSYRTCPRGGDVSVVSSGIVDGGTNICELIKRRKEDIISIQSRKSLFGRKLVKNVNASGMKMSYIRR